MSQFTRPEIWKRHAVLVGIYEDFGEFGCQFEDRFLFILMKTKHPVHIMVFGVDTTIHVPICPHSQHGGLLRRLQPSLLLCMMQG